jgi:hypothetical protein
VYNKTNKKFTKKSKPTIVDLPNDGPLSIIPLSALLSKYHKNKSRHTVKVLNKDGQLDARWIKQELPMWQAIWSEKGIKIRWDRRQRSFFLTAIK